MAGFDLEKIGDSDDRERLSATSSELDEGTDQYSSISQTPKKWKHFYIVTFTVFFTISLVLNAVLIRSQFMSTSKSLTTIQTPHNSPLSSALLSITTSHTVQFNGTLFPPNPIPWSRIEPGSLADTIWDDFSLPRHFPISASQLLRSGKDPSTAARFPNDADWHLGEDAYIASFDVFHQIHCLNELRKTAFAHYPPTHQEEGDIPEHRRRKRRGRREHSELWWMHLQHCTDMLLQNIICHADPTDLVTYEWKDTQENPYPDFSSVKVCRDFDALVSWQKEHEVSYKMYEAMKKPEDVKVTAMEQGYYDMFGYEGSVLFPRRE